MAAELSGDGTKGKAANAEAKKSGVKAVASAKKKGGLAEYNESASSDTTR